MHTIWSIPELVRSIIDRLPQKELVKTIAISRLFWETVVPLLWEDVTLRQLGEVLQLGNDNHVNKVRTCTALRFNLPSANGIIIPGRRWRQFTSGPAPILRRIRQNTPFQ